MHGTLTWQAYIIDETESGNDACLNRMPRGWVFSGDVEWCCPIAGLYEGQIHSLKFISLAIFLSSAKYLQWGPYNYLLGAQGIILIIMIGRHYLNSYILAFF